MPGQPTGWAIGPCRPHSAEFFFDGVAVGGGGFETIKVGHGGLKIRIDAEYRENASQPIGWFAG